MMGRAMAKARKHGGQKSQPRRTRAVTTQASGIEQDKEKPASIPIATLNRKVFNERLVLDLKRPISGSIAG